MPTFSSLWDKYPDKAFMKATCKNIQANSSTPFGNYCAINLSEVLIRNGVQTSKIKVKKCWGHQGMKHILLAEEMAGWLKNTHFGWLGKCEKINPKTFQEDLNGRTGIIFFKDYWTRGNESLANRSGDHIDLWNKDEITSQVCLSEKYLSFWDDLVI
jgi:hypothetical protein